ncbi:MAG: Gfo/Idh/MocA family oxidoreductase [Candidatus Omnitrophica bacterium]|nr:Gfo/Idh/MocA family oxidoreductase [Candidatus Omnitrophota bacterium]
MRCIIFGYGYMGKIRYEVLRRHPKVRSIVVVDPALNAASVSGLGVVALPEGAPIPWETCDAAFICTPNHATADLCIESLRRCGRVFCEKPPGRHWDDFSRIAEAAARIPDHTLVFGFNHRLHPSVQAAKALVGPGGLGEILYVKGTYGKSGGLRFRENWRSNLELAGGGILLDQGIHMLDVFHLFLDGPLTVVDAVLANAFWGVGGEDNAFVLMRSAQGIPAFLHSSATLWKHTFRIEIGCRDGYLVASGLLSQTGSYGREQLVIGKRQFEDEAMALGNPREEIIYFDRDESWEKEVNEFLDAAIQRRPATHGTLEDARRAMQVVRDAYALAEGQRAKGHVSCD